MPSLHEDLAIQMTLMLIAALVALTSAEYLYALATGRIGESSLFSWAVCSARQGWMYQDRWGRILNITFHPNLLSIVIVTRCACSLALLISNDRAILCTCCVFLSLTGLLLCLRHEHGRDGADQMSLILVIGITMYLIFDVNSSWRWAGVALIVGQATLSYIVSGVAKLLSKEWRSGSAITAVFLTSIYGCPPVGRILHRQRVLAGVTSWFLIAWEVTFPAVLITPWPYAGLWIVVGVVFHLSAAVFMGLNTFLISFVATYPLLLWCNLEIHKHF